MAERTGDPTLDALLDEFVQTMEEREPGLSQELRQPEGAAGQCGDISSWFHDWLCGYPEGKKSKQRLPSWPEAGLGFGGTFYYPDLRSNERSNHPWTGFPICGPDDFGYTDRSIRGWDDHEATLLRDTDDTVFCVDWTAAQYGYNQFPMVLRLSFPGWLRDGWLEDRVPELTTTGG